MAGPHTSPYQQCHVGRRVAACKGLGRLPVVLRERRTAGYAASPPPAGSPVPGYLSYSNRHADLLFELSNRRHEQKSTLIPENMDADIIPVESLAASSNCWPAQAPCSS